MRMEEMEGMEAVEGPELAVVVADNDDDVFNVEGFEREATVDASDEAIEEGTPEGPEEEGRNGKCKEKKMER